MTTAREPAPARFEAGDALRGLACVTIAVWHTVLAWSAAHGTLQTGLRGLFGAVAGPPVWGLYASLWLFFALSGYLLGAPFARAIVLGTAAPDVVRYARNRLLRIAPAYWLVLVVTLVLVGSGGDDPGQILLFFGFAHVYDQGPFTIRMVQAWALDVLAVFYVVLPLLALPAARLVGARGTPRARVAALLAGLTAVAAASLALGQEAPTSGRIVPGAAWAFVPGLAIAVLEPLVRERLAAWRHAAAAAAALLAASVAAYALDVYVAHGPRTHDLAAAAACGAAMSAALLWQWRAGGGRALLSSAPARWLGTRSYGLFLVHVLVIYELRSPIGSLGRPWQLVVLVVPLVLAISLVLAELLHRFVERPVLALRASWR